MHINVSVFLLLCSMDGENEDKENSQLSRIQFSEVLHLAGGDGLPTLGKFSDVRVCT